MPNLTEATSVNPQDAVKRRDMNLPNYSPRLRASMGASELLGAEGPFASEVPNFAPRPSQQDMAEAVESAIADGHALIAEAGTGTG